MTRSRPDAALRPDRSQRAVCIADNAKQVKTSLHNSSLHSSFCASKLKRKGAKNAKSRKARIKIEITEGMGMDKKVRSGWKSLRRDDKSAIRILKKRNLISPRQTWSVVQLAPSSCSVSLCGALHLCVKKPMWGMHTDKHQNGVHNSVCRQFRLQ